MPGDVDRPPRGTAGPSAHASGSAEGDDGLASHLSDLARTLQTYDSPDGMLDEIVSAAVQLIPGVQEGSISAVLGRKQVELHAASGEIPGLVDQAQMRAGEGPCLDAVYEQKTVRVPDMRHEQRWPIFAGEAYAAGAGSMLAFQLFVEGDNLGALNLYSRAPDAFDDESEHVGLLFAAHAAVAYAEVRKVEQLEVAMTTRDLIGQAKGILMERYRISGVQAFNVLTRASQNTNRKLRDVATELVESRELRQE